MKNLDLTRRDIMWCMAHGEGSIRFTLEKPEQEDVRVIYSGTQVAVKAK